jgi:hypothetical protein
MSNFGDNLPASTVVYALAVMGVFWWARVARAQTTPFEGVITYHIPNGEDDATMRYYVKGSKVRIDMAGTGSASVIYDLQSGSVIALNHDMHAYMSLDPMGVNPARLGGGMGPIANMLSGLANQGSSQGPQRTGTHERIAGVECDDYSFHSDTISVDVCNAPGMKSFPLSIRTSVGGAPGFEAKATSVVPTSLSPSLFMIPSGYQSLTGSDLQALTKGAGQQAPVSGADEQP